MAVIFDERPESRSWSLAENRGTLEYNLIGTAGEAATEVDAAAIASANVSVFRNGAWLQDIILKPQGPGFWYVTCPYGPLPKMPGSIEITFRSTGGSEHIASSKSMVAKYGTGAPNTVIIGQDGAGAEITVPVQLRSYTFNFARGIVTESAMDYWETLTGIVNSVPWRNRPAGEVLFLGAEGKTTISADSNSSVTFNMAMSRNKTGQTIGSITGIAKQGQDLIDIHTKTVVVAGQDVQKEKFVYIQRVYDRANFLTVLGF
jgi:hypothetical protein